jgi:hypothetical protein
MRITVGVFASSAAAVAVFGTLLIAAACGGGKSGRASVAAATRPTVQAQTITLTTTNAYVKGQSQFEDDLPVAGAVKVEATSCMALRGGGGPCTLTFTHPDGLIALAAHTCEPALRQNGSCTLTFATAPGGTTIGKLLKGGKTTAFKVITPPANLVKVA